LGSISAYETAAGRRYRARYRKPDGSSTDKRGFRTRRQAAHYLSGVESTKSKVELNQPTFPELTINALGTQWLAGQIHLKPSSLSVIEIAWRVHVRPRWGSTDIHQIRSSEIQAWVSDLSKTRSATVVIRAHGILAGILDFAIRDQLLTKNAARGVHLPRKFAKPRHYLNHLQVEALAEAAKHHKTLVLLLAYTGIRWGEAVALKVGSIDLERRRIVIRSNATNVRGIIIEGVPKNGRARSVPLPEFLIDELSMQCEGRTSQSLAFGNGVDFLPTPTHGDGWFACARNRSRLSDPTMPAKLTLHDLRHTAASLAISAGANAKVVQRMLGHASAAMTLDTYADLFDDDLDSAALALDLARTKARAAQMHARTDANEGLGNAFQPNEIGAPGGI
jgi:integrase